ncbi:5027_t:CDS:2 [Entrophospora sp. SA101]|nr:5306_t:CDS:2 [Entrophospora sp. SA101]CAJ0765684.1 5027_t:CDS:2 [Entrophospora sp. SA101]CAJ0833285.1 18978_t:CDS:2 [Entrophospora sp. SA101]CAJ0841523.1 11752_t:CDS:2 [Entrophospora sp. SA101]
MQNAIVKLDKTWKKPVTIASTQTVTGQLGVLPAQKKTIPETQQSEIESPNRILYIQNLPSDVTDEMLSFLFQQYPGFKEVCLVPGKSDIAFVEYEADHKATVAKDVLNRFKITHDKEMKVIFARR